MSVNAVQHLKTYASLVKFSHTIFALPFALSMFIIVAQRYPFSVSQLICILLALVTARTAAMAFNRLSDRNIDAKNPRTREREIPAGKLSVREVYFLLLVNIICFIASAAYLGIHCLVLSPIVLFVLLGYSWTKRFTAAAHIFLGLALALAPGGVWYALTAQWSWTPIPLMLGVLLWVAGFDILYSCQDFDFDKANNLFSVPVKFGIQRSFIIARLLHLLAFLFLVEFGIVAQLGITYFIGVVVFGLIIASQHLLISPNDLSRINAAFFTRNGIASVVFMLVVWLDRVIVKLF